MFEKYVVMVCKVEDVENVCVCMYVYVKSIRYHSVVVYIQYSCFYET